MVDNSHRRRAASFRELTVWQFAMDLAVEIYAVSGRFPRDERFGLTAQLRRAAVSVAANIAEGNARHSRAEYRHFVSVAHGSVAEIETELSLAERLRFAEGDELSKVRALSDSISRMLTNLRRSLHD
ncbi:MAG TPA: four helix bundle protein [Gemmatimonadaceae bacterium]|jgi:four helix bundle protein|nr:four helix bundle protein [Gemmatimonadaceae bacterium]